jgi:hypothetical protein
MNPNVVFALQCVGVLLLVAGVFYYLNKKLSYQMGAIESLQFQILEQNKRVSHQENVMRQVFGIAAPPSAPAAAVFRPPTPEPGEPSSPFVDVGPMMSGLMGMLGSLTPRPPPPPSPPAEDDEELEEELSEELSELSEPPTENIKEGRVDEVAATGMSGDNS